MHLYLMFLAMAALTILSPGPSTLKSLTNALNHGLGAALVGMAGLLLMLGLTIGPAPQASAAIGGCSTWVTTYKGFLGVTIYRGHLACYGSIPGKEYRAKIYCKLAGQTGNVQYGGWKKEGSGKDSYNSCPWPWQTSKYDIHIQTR